MTTYKEFLLSRTAQDFEEILNPYFLESGNFFSTEEDIRDFYKVILKYFHFMIYEEYIKVNPCIDTTLYKEERLKILKQNLKIKNFQQIGSKIGGKRACTPKDVKASFSILQTIFPREKLISYIFSFEKKESVFKFDALENLKNSEEYQEFKQLEELEQRRLTEEFGITIKPISNINFDEIPTEFFTIHGYLHKQKKEYDSLNNEIYNSRSYSYESQLYDDMQYIAENMLTIFQEYTFNYTEEKLDLLLNYVFFKDDFLYSDIIYNQMNNRTKFENIMYVDSHFLNLKRAEAKKNTQYANRFKQLFASAAYNQQSILDNKQEKERQRRQEEDRAYRLRYELEE